MKHYLIPSLFLCISLFSCKKSLTSIVADADKAVFTIYTYDEFGSPSGSGSGFFIKSEGIAVTNYHVLDNSVKAIIKTASKEEYEISNILFSSKEKDLVVFSINNPAKVEFSTIQLSSETPLKGGNVINVGSPLGLENSVSQGIVSSYREDAHGRVVQITAAISPGSSGSPIMDDNGDVFAVATFQRTQGQNLNFGVVITDEILASMTSNDFIKLNPKFKNHENFTLLNIQPDKGSEITLNAIEFSNTATILYLTYTNLHLSQDGIWMVWCEVGRKDEGFYIEDKDSHQRYYLTSSTLGCNKETATKINLARSIQFKVYFPKINILPKKLDIMWGNTSRGIQFTNIDLEQFRSKLNVDDAKYTRDYAISVAAEDGNFEGAVNILTSLLENNPNDILTINTLGIISYAIDNNSDAKAYFSQAIEKNPTNELAYLNRACVFEFQNNFTDAIQDVSSAINLISDQPDYYYQRSTYYWKTENYENVVNDLNMFLKYSDSPSDAALALEFRAIAFIALDDREAAKEDIKAAYKLSKDPELDKRLQAIWERL